MNEGHDDDMSTELAALDELPVGDQWAEIVARARGDAEVVDLAAERRIRPASRVGRLLVGVAAAVVLLLVGLTVGRTTAPGRTDPVARSVAPPSTWSLGPSTPLPGLTGALPLVASADGVRVVAARGADSVSLVSAGGDAGAVPLDGGVQALAAGRDRDGGFIAVVLTESGSLWTVDGAGGARTLTAFGPAPSGAGSVAVAGGRVFVAGTDAGALVAVEADGTVRRLAAGGLRPAVIAGRDDDLWALSRSRDRVALFSASSGRMTGSVAVDGGSLIAAGPGHLYVLRRSAGVLTVVGTDVRARYLTRISELTTSLSATRRNVWAAGDGVMTAYAVGSGRFDGVVVLPVASDIGVTSDDRSTWSVSAATGVTRLVRDP